MNPSSVTVTPTAREGRQERPIDKTGWVTAILVTAAALLVAGSVAWVFPHETAAVAGPRLLPVLSLISLLMALGLATEWHVLGGLILVLAVTLVLGLNQSSITSTTHFAGACLGLLAMLTIGRTAGTPGRLRLAMMAFLGAGIVVLLLGLAGASYGAGEVPTLRLGLAGLPVGGGVNTNALAATVLLVAPLGVSVLILRTREKADWLTLLPIATTLVVIGVVTLVACRSLSAGMAVWLILVGFLVRGMSSRRFRIVTSAIVVAPVLIASGSTLFQSEETLSRAASGWSRSARSRIPIMTHGLERWTESPWFGIGLNEFRSTYAGATDDTLPVERKDEGRDVAHAHNIFLQTVNL